MLTILSKRIGRLSYLGGKRSADDTEEVPETEYDDYAFPTTSPSTRIALVSQYYCQAVALAIYMLSDRRGWSGDSMNPLEPNLPAGGVGYKTNRLVTHQL